MSNSCDACSGRGGAHVISTDKKYNDLYLTILKIGQAKVSTGLNYYTLLNELRSHQYDIDNDCVLLAVKYWFFHSFYHLPDAQNPCNKVEDLDNHSTCNFILKGESSLVLIEHETMEKSIKQSKTAIRWAVIAVVVSLLAISQIQDGIRGAFKKLEPHEQPPKSKIANAQTSFPNLSDSMILDTSLEGTPNKKTN